MIYIIGIAVTFLLAFILLAKSNKSLADKILVVWLIVIALHLIFYEIIHTGRYSKIPFFLGLERPWPLLHGPFLFLYTTALTSRLIIDVKKLSHFILFVISLLLIAPFLLLSSADKVQVYNSNGEPYHIIINVIFYATIISGVAYSLFSLRALLVYKRNLNKVYSYTEKINLQWLFNLIIGLSCIWILVMAGKDEYIFSSVVIYVLFIGYFGIKQVGIFTEQPPNESIKDLKIVNVMVESMMESDDSKYEKSLLSDEQLQAIHADLVELIRQKKVHLIPELNLAMLSRELDVHPNILSQVINRAEQKNFFDYINALRVEEFKLRASRPESRHLTLLALAHECGFNSKTSFNRNFKKLSGQSPSEYLKEARIDLQ